MWSSERGERGCRARASERAGPPGVRRALGAHAAPHPPHPRQGYPPAAPDRRATAFDGPPGSKRDEQARVVGSAAQVDRSGDYDEASVPPVAIGRQRTCPSPDWLSGRVRATTAWFPRSRWNRSIREAPSSTPAASPRLRRRPSPWPPHRQNYTAAESRNLHPHLDPRALQTGPDPPGFEPASRLRSVQHWSLTLHLLILLDEPAPSGSTSTPRLCRGRLPPSPAFPWIGLPPLHQAAATQRTVAALDPHRASWRTAPSRRIRRRLQDLVRPPRDSTEDSNAAPAPQPTRPTDPGRPATVRRTESNVSLFSTTISTGPSPTRAVCSGSVTR